MSTMSPRRDGVSVRLAGRPGLPAQPTSWGAFGNARAFLRYEEVGEGPARSNSLFGCLQVMDGVMQSAEGRVDLLINLAEESIV